MRAIKQAATVAPVGEVLLCTAFTLFGRFSFTGDGGGTNLVASATLFFHAPGLFLGQKLFGTPLCLSALALAVITGAAQLFLLTWGGLELPSILRRHTLSTWIGIVLWAFVVFAALVMIVAPLAAWVLSYVLR